MLSSRTVGLLAALGACALTTPARADVWGGFDTSRVNYPDGVLTGAAHATLRSILAANGDTVGALTPTLTPAYLDGIDVFYTSLLTNNGVPLTAAEQQALQGWVAGGGKLIVTGDVFNPQGYTSFVSFLGVTMTASNGTGVATTTGSHPIVAGVDTIAFTTNAGIAYGAAPATLLATFGAEPFAIAFDAASGYQGGGCVLVLGDHNAFTESFIGNEDNVAFVTNFVGWTRTCDLAALGTPCLLDGDCASGACVDGVCCDGPCGGGATGDCQACSVAAGAAANGTCGAVAAMTECRAAAGACDVAEACDGASLACPADAPAANGSPCTDGNACTEGDVCQAGACVPGPDADCASEDACQIGACDPIAGCVSTPADDGTTCDDGDACTTDDTCTGGSCGGTSPLACDDGEECTADACDGSVGCVFTAVADGTPCGGDGVCAAGACTASPGQGGGGGEGGGGEGGDQGAGGDGVAATGAGGASGSTTAAAGGAPGSTTAAAGGGEGGGADGGDGAAADGGGCDCNVRGGGGSGGSSSLVLAGMIAALARRRRRVA